MNISKKTPGLMAFAIGLALVFSQSAFKSAVSSPEKKLLSYEFKFIGPSNPTQGQVENIANWQYDPSASQACASGQDKPCRINVSAAYVDATGAPATPPALQSTLNLQADENPTTHTYYVNGSDDVSMVITNRAQ